MTVKKLREELDGYDGDLKVTLIVREQDGDFATWTVRRTDTRDFHPDEDLVEIHAGEQIY